MKIGYLMIVGSTPVMHNAVQAVAMNLNEYAETGASGAVEPAQAVIAAAVAVAVGSFIYIKRHWRIH